jgi:simple sugar transport system substrate-binding protein
MKDGFIKLAPINASVPQPVKDQVAKIETDIKAGTFHPFSGSVKDQSGKERLGAGKTMSDEDLGKMDYYVQGVTSKLPKS